MVLWTRIRHPWFRMLSCCTVFLSSSSFIRVWTETDANCNWLDRRVIQLRGGKFAVANNAALCTANPTIHSNEHLWVLQTGPANFFGIRFVGLCQITNERKSLFSLSRSLSRSNFDLHCTNTGGILRALGAYLAQRQTLTRPQIL